MRPECPRWLDIEPTFDARPRPAVVQVELDEQVARVYHGPAPEARAAAIVYAGNYVEAVAFYLFGPRLGLPKLARAYNLSAVGGACR